MTRPSSAYSGAGAQEFSSALARDVQGALRKAIGDVLQTASQAPADDLPALAVMPAAKATMPQRLAGAQPGGPTARRDSEKLYARCLAHYRRSVQPRLVPGVQHDDVGVAAAYFVLANMAALRPIEPDEAVLAQTERQLRQLISRTRAWEGASAVDRQQLFEQFAIIGVLINETRLAAPAQGPAAVANVQRAARGYLLQLLGLDPDLLAVGPSGLAATTSAH
jgi:hypothetical protein